MREQQAVGEGEEERAGGGACFVTVTFFAQRHNIFADPASKNKPCTVYMTFVFDDVGITAFR